MKSILFEKLDMCLKKGIVVLKNGQLFEKGNISSKKWTAVHKKEYQSENVDNCAKMRTNGG